MAVTGIGALAGVIYVIALIAVNLFTLDELQTWLEQCIWGTKKLARSNEGPQEILQTTVDINTMTKITIGEESKGTK